MKNIFSAHTPYHLLLSAGIASIEFSKSYNALFISRDFYLDQSIVTSLNLIFDEVQVIKGDFDYMRIGRGRNVFKLIDIYRTISSAKETTLNKHKFTNMFIFNNFHVIDKKIMQLVNINNRCKITYIEDGIAVYIRGEIVRNEALYRIKWFLKKRIFNLGRYGSCVKVLGDEAIIKDCRVLFPEHINNELSKKKVSEITVAQLRKGIVSLYEADVHRIGDLYDAIIILLDLSINVKNMIEYITIIESIVLISKVTKKKIYIKYHPREENDYIEFLFSKYEFIKKVKKEMPSEVILYNCISDVYLISTYTTSFVASKKLNKGIKNISLIELLGIEELYDIYFLKKIGVEFPGKINDIQKIIEQHFTD